MDGGREHGVWVIHGWMHGARMDVRINSLLVDVCVAHVCTENRLIHVCMLDVRMDA